jgi:hypothetical protein
LANPDAEPLSVFLDTGVVPRSTRSDNRNELGADLSKYLVVQPGDLVFNKLRTWQGGFGSSRQDDGLSGRGTVPHHVASPLGGLGFR